MKKAPLIYKGKRKVSEDHFIAPHDYPSESDALHKLNAIREANSFVPGWVEIDASIEQLPNGTWHVEYLRAKYE